MNRFIHINIYSPWLKFNRSIIHGEKKCFRRENYIEFHGKNINNELNNEAIVTKQS